MNKNKRKTESTSEARKGAQEAPKMSKNDPKFVPKRASYLCFDLLDLILLENALLVLHRYPGGRLSAVQEWSLGGQSY